MPFRKISANKYVSPSGRKYTRKQVIAYYASDGWTKRSRAQKQRIARRKKKRK